jgi:hypothetical protein
VQLQVQGLQQQAGRLRLVPVLALVECSLRLAGSAWPLAAAELSGHNNSSSSSQCQSRRSRQQVAASQCNAVVARRAGHCSRLAASLMFSSGVLSRCRLLTP